MKQILKKIETYACGWLFLIVVAVLCLFTTDSVCQVKNYNVWMVSLYDLIYFNSEQAVVVDTPISNYGEPREYYGSPLSLADDDGNLILYGGAWEMYDVEGKIVSNIYAFYGCFAVKVPTATDNYYIFTSGHDNNGHARYIHHVYKDSSGCFAVRVVKKIELSGGMTGGVDGNEIFFITADDFDEKISVYVVRDGESECVQTFTIPENMSVYHNYVMRFNADFTKLYTTTPNGDRLYIFDFDIDTKIIGDYTSISMDQLKAFDFSENGDYIYFLQGLRGEYTVTRCRETDLPNLTNIETVATLTGKWENHSGNLEDLQLAPDGNIYIGIYRWDKLSYITETDGECVFHEDAIELSNPFGGRFPKMPRYQSSCRIEQCNATVEPKYRGYPYMSISWDFGDGTPIVNDEHPVHHYEKPGKYTVTMTTAFKNGIVKEVKKIVEADAVRKPKIVKE